MHEATLITVREVSTTKRVLDTLGSIAWIAFFGTCVWVVLTLNHRHSFEEKIRTASMSIQGACNDTITLEKDVLLIRVHEKIVEETIPFNNIESVDATISPGLPPRVKEMVKALFGVNGITGFVFEPYKVTIYKDESHGWEDIADGIKIALQKLQPPN